MSSDLERARERTRRITLRRFASSKAADAHDLEFWQQISPDDRILLTWTLSKEQWQLAGYPPHEPGLHRSVESGDDGSRQDREIT